MTGCTAKAWLAMASGGRWTFGELRKAVIGPSPKTLENAVRSMVTAGMARRYDGETISYGITSDCTIPRGMTIEQVMRAVQGKAL
jgi:DNA-binding HxlR family transcriptional regulator